MNNKENRYIIKRKIKALFYSIPFYLFRVFPIKKNRIVMWTFEGQGGYACCPKYIAEEIIKRNKNTNNKPVEIVWILSDLDKKFPSRIKKVKDTWLHRAYYMTTARFWIGNTRTFLGTKKRKGTIYIQTWHGTISLKPIGKYRGEKFSKIAYIVSKADSDLIDYLISGSDYCTKMWRDGLLYDGEILQLGTARCDVLFNGVEEKHKQLRDEYNLPQDSKICVYAPTFRGGSQSTNRNVNAEEVTLDFDRLINTLEKKFGGVWYVFLRLHPQVAAIMNRLPVDSSNERLIDVSQRPDMAEIMAATDCIITDYSTVIFEGFLTGQPGFIYADDFDEYVEDRGKLMFRPDEIPFSIARTNDELEYNVKGFSFDGYINKVEFFMTQHEVLEDGHACERVVKEILSLMGKGVQNGR